MGEEFSHAGHSRSVGNDGSVGAVSTVHCRPLFVSSQISEL